MNSSFSKSRLSKQNNASYLITFFFYLMTSYMITVASLLLLAMLLYKIPLSESAVNIGIVIIYILSTFLSSFICGKKLQHKKYLWGFLIGSIYFSILLLISLLTNNSANGLLSNVITTYLICAGSGTLGGMLA